MAQSPLPRRSPLRLGHSAGRLTAVLARLDAHPQPWSWVLWAVAVGLFAFWGQAHMQVPLGPRWIGMLVHSVLYATLTLVMREWFALRWAVRADHDGSAGSVEEQLKSI